MFYERHDTSCNCPQVFSKYVHKWIAIACPFQGYYLLPLLMFSKYASLEYYDYLVFIQKKIKGIMMT